MWICGVLFFKIHALSELISFHTFHRHGDPIVIFSVFLPSKNTPAIKPTNYLEHSYGAHDYESTSVELYF